jgi:hypothetical protein
VSIAFLFDTGHGGLVTHKICRSAGPAARRKKNCNHPGLRAVIYFGGGTVNPGGKLNMYECVFRSRRHGDSGLVASELSISGIQRGRQSSGFRKGKFVLVLLGCALCACADDSTADNTHRKHRHGSSHGREQMETVDRPNNSSPPPALGW